MKKNRLTNKGKVIAESKTEGTDHPSHNKQLLTYLRLSEMKLGIS